MKRAARRRRPWLAIGAFASLGAVLGLGSLASSMTGGCAPTPIEVPLRSLERSGAVSYVCLGIPGDPAGVLKPLAACTTSITIDPQTFALDDAGTLLVPHLYAMVTQTTRGEVAMVDITAQDNSVIDEDPGIPGANFMPIGAQPVDIQSTPGSTATFVGVAEVGHEGIFALPSNKIRPSSLLADAGVEPEGIPLETPQPVPQLSSWPACSLPSAPGSMLLVADPLVSGAERPTCDSPYGVPPQAGPNGDLHLEGQGRQKLVVAMPDLGGLVVIDAQTLLDRPAGSFDACPVERWLPLEVDLPASPAPPQKPNGPACVWPVQQGPEYDQVYKPRPAGLSYASDTKRLFIADLVAPVVHVLDLPSPCTPRELKPLLPTSVDDPTRLVITSKVSVGALTSDLQHQYLYAVDEKDESAMVFDVGDGSQPKKTTPLQRANPQYDPFDPRDRIRMGSPIADLIVVTHDSQQPLPQTGVAQVGTFCSPDPRLTCELDATHCDVPALYRTDPTYEIGAGPQKLRGQFAFAALTNGHIGVVDIEDYDAPCRVPQWYSKLYGCPPPIQDPAHLLLPGVTGTESDPAYVDVCSNGTDLTKCLASSAEQSCATVLPNTIRASVYTSAAEDAGFHMSGVTQLPFLYDENGTVIEDPNAPRMAATVPSGSCAGTCVGDVGVCMPGAGTGSACGADPHDLKGKCTLSCTVTGSASSCTASTAAVGDACGTDAPVTVAVAGVPLATCKQIGVSDPGTTGTTACFDETQGWYVDPTITGETADGTQVVVPQNSLIMNLEDPHAQAVDQSWAVTWEGAIPGFTDTLGTLQLTPKEGLYDPNARFCDFGVHSQNAVKDLFAQQGLALSPEDYADYVQIQTDIPLEADPYWTGVDSRTCGFAQCNTTFGAILTPAAGRDLRIVEAYEDHVELVNRSDGKPVDLDLVNCCFPPPVAFSVRVGSQWAVVGSTSGFLHHVIPDPVTGVCRDNCDPTFTRMNGRVIPVPPDLPPPAHDGDVPGEPTAPYAFINPMFRFVVFSCPSNALPCIGVARDSAFNFTTQGSFQALYITLAPDGSTLMQPVQISLVPPTGELNVVDGSIQGLTLVEIGSAAVSRRFF